MSKRHKQEGTTLQQTDANIIAGSLLEIVSAYGKPDDYETFICSNKKHILGALYEDEEKKEDDEKDGHEEEE